MARRERRYVRLPGRGRRTGSFFEATSASATAWLGPDHLLIVERYGYRERYKRFRYQEIQAILMRRTRRMEIESITMAALAALVFGAGWAVGGTGFVVASVVSGCFTLCALTIWLRGPRCVCHVRTAVQNAEVVAWQHTRAFRKALARLEPRVAESQADLAVAAVPEGRPAGAADGGLTVPRPAASRPPAPRRPFRKTVHRLLFMALLVDALLTGAIIPANHVALWIGGSLFAVVVAVLAVAALIRLRQTGVRGLVAVATWLALAYVGAGYAVGNAMTFFVGSTDPDSLGNQWAILENLASLRAQERPLMLGLLVGLASLACGVGCLGLFALGRMGPSAAPPPLPVPAGPEEPRSVGPPP